MGEVFPKYKCRKFKVRSLILSCKNFQLNNPTHVGKRLRSVPRTALCSVQPHACGEKPKDLYRTLRYYVSLELTYSVSQNLPSDP